MSSTLLTTLRPAAQVTATATPAVSLWTLLKAATTKLIDALTVSSQLQARQVLFNGEMTWYAYNPKTGQSFFVDTEAELRQWIEDSYNEI